MHPAPLAGLAGAPGIPRPPRRGRGGCHPYSEACQGERSRCCCCCCCCCSALTLLAMTMRIELLFTAPGVNEVVVRNVSSLCIIIRQCKQGAFCSG